MALITSSRVATEYTNGMVLTWPAMQNGDVGEAQVFSDFSDRTMQVSGTFGVGGSCRLEGSNDGDNWSVLHDVFGSAATLTSAGLASIAEVTRFVRPVIPAGDGTTSLTVNLLVKAAR